MPNRTSPVRRGKWILENLLGTPPPPPPPNVPPLKDQGASDKPKTMREQMEEHRANPVCANCHRLMDPLGFAMENFDGVGAWRTKDGADVHRCVEPARGWHQGQRRRHASSGADASAGAVCRHDDREADDLRPRPRACRVGHAGRAPDRQQRRAEQLPLLVDRARDRQQRAVPDADEARNRESPLPPPWPRVRRRRTMFLTNMSLPRRTFLQGVGATIALPFLEAMLPAFKASAAAEPVRRFGAVYVPHGKMMANWTPLTPGADFDFPRILKPLEPFRSQVSIISGLSGPPIVANGGHAVAPSGYLSGHSPKQTEGEDILAATTIDQIIAKKIGQEHAAAVARGRDRRLQHVARRLRHRLQLRLHEHHLVGRPDEPAADGRRIRAACSSGCSASRARRSAVCSGCRKTAAFSTRSRESVGASAEDARRARSGQADRLPRQRARDRAPHRAGREDGRRQRRRCRTRRSGRPKRIRNTSRCCST